MEKKKMPLPKKKPRHASPKHRMNTEKTKPLGQAGGGKLKMGEKGGKLALMNRAYNGLTRSRKSSIA